jgi:GTP-binding protein
MQPPRSKRVVALVGRPNVGKSALFNRLVGRRVAIVHNEPGVTRDRIECEARWGDERFLLIDTGGIGVLDNAAEGDAIAAGARRQVELALEEAAAILLVVDVVAGATPLDEEVGRLLRRRGRPVFVAANKADHEGLDAGADDFARLGFPAFPVSALHNRGLDALMAAVRPALPPPDAADAPPALRVAVIGRPNAGKSSYVNRLLGDERVIVSDVPGTTRDSIEIPFAVGEGPAARPYLLIDTAGLRHGGRTREAVETWSAIRVEETIRRADVVVLVIDAREGPSRQDKRLADLAVTARRGCVLLVNKWDLVRGTSPREYEEALRREMPFLAFAPLCFASARTGRGVRETIETIDRVAAAVSATMTTGVLNRVLHAAFERRSPPSIRGRRLKLFYASQAGTSPVRIRLFANDPDLCTPAFEQYLVHNLRNAFDLEGAPVVMIWTARPREERGHGRSAAAPAARRMRRRGARPSQEAAGGAIVRP